jgi:hypothetical protein
MGDFKYPSLTTDRSPKNLRDHQVNGLVNGAAAGRSAVLNRGIGAGPDPLALEG